MGETTDIKPAEGGAEGASAPTSAEPAGGGTPYPYLSALCVIARLHNIAADPATLAHQLGLTPGDTVDTPTLLHAARHLGLKAKATRTSLE